MTIWPPEDLAGTRLGSNDAGHRPDDAGIGPGNDIARISDIATIFDDPTEVGGDGAGLDSDGVGLGGDGVRLGGAALRVGGAVLSVGGATPRVGGAAVTVGGGGVAIDDVNPVDTTGAQARLVPAAVGRLLPVTGATAPPRLAAAPAAARPARPFIEVASGATTVERLGARSVAVLPGAGPLTAFLVDPSVTDVLVNGVDVWIDRGAGLVRCNLTFSSDMQVRRLAQRLAAACGRRLDEGSPYVDARLPDGTRLHAVLPPVAANGPYLSLRTFREHAFSLNDLVGVGTVSDSGAEMLGAIVAARLSYLVSGGTGSGKTTLLATLLSEVPRDERIVIVEDAAELRPHHPHVVGLQARTANVEGAGAIGLRDLLRQALRMRPDRLVVGECRGAEVVDLLAALNTGHEGGAGTLHANTAADVPARLEALGLLSGVPRAALHAQVAAALHVVVHMRRMPTGRLLDEIVLLRPTPDGRAVTSVSAWHRLGGVRPGAVPLANLMTSRGVRPPTALLAGRP
jgi:pilus assembly protein CpaF